MEPKHTINFIVASARESRIRLRIAREAARASEDDLARFVDNSVSWYFDLENCDGELHDNIEIGQLSGLCAALGIKSRELFETENSTQPSIDAGEICSKINIYLDTTNTSIKTFEDRVGYTIQPCLLNSAEVLKWNIDCLRLVCNEIGANWLHALP